MLVKPRSRRRMGQVVLSLAAGLALLPLVRPLLLAVLASDAVVFAVLAGLYGVPSTPTARSEQPAIYELQRDRVAGRIERRFLSYSLDSSQVAGGHWWSDDGHVELPVGTTRVAPFDFSRPEVLRLARGLSPAYLRVGGTEADNLHYAIDRESEALPRGYDLSLSRRQWDALHAFVTAAGLSLMFTVNAGPGPRDAAGAWQATDLEPLLAYSAERGYRVPVWELGNEVNAYWLTHGLGNHVGGRQYARDMQRFAVAVHRYFPGAKVAGGAVFVWPVMGEPPPRLMESFLRHSAVEPDIVTWHYYPQQSRRCWSATRRATPTRMLEPRFLDEFAQHAATFTELSTASAGQRSRAPEVWLGETGGAQCGGEPGVSDRFASSLWWLDQLGLAARMGQRVVVRQTLTGGNYGLIDDRSLRPRPDYWASLLWKRLMGERVLAIVATRDNPHLRAYAHCHPGGAGRATVLAINLSDNPLSLVLPELRAGVAVRHVTAPSLAAETVVLNGAPLRLQPDGSLPATPAVPLSPGPGLALAPLSYAFVVVDGIPACR